MSQYKPPEPGYSCSFEFNNTNLEPVLHLVVHLPADKPDQKKQFTIIRNTDSAFIAEEGEMLRDKDSSEKRSA